jgi:release factor glutamine methyltransferase
MPSNDIWTIQRIIAWTTQYFKRNGIEEPRLDAELLLAHVLQKKRIYLYTHFEEMLNREELAAYHQIIEKRVKGICVAALTGHKSFMGLDFAVNEHVLIPRPDTEAWLEKLIQHYRGEQGLKVLDLGTGSGAILLSFLYYCHGIEGTGVDISPEALEVAKENGEKLGVSDRVMWLEGDFLSAVGDEVYDGIFSNPPYIPSGDIPSLQKEVQNEPILALDGGEDGLKFYRILASEGGKYLKTGGFLAMEVGIHQAEAVRQMLEESGDFTDIETIPDMGGIERAVTARKK